MSFRFNDETFQGHNFHEEFRKMLQTSLNRYSAKSGENTNNGRDGFTGMSTHNILHHGIEVKKIEFNSIPRLEILDLDVSGQSKSLLRGICKMSCENILLEIQADIESNLLVLSTSMSPSFTTPSIVCNDSFTLPITMTFKDLRMETITNIFVTSSGMSVYFNDVSLNFQFASSMKLLQSSIEKRLKKAIQHAFKDVLPGVIFSSSKSWFSNHLLGLIQSPATAKLSYDPLESDESNNRLGVHDNVDPDYMFENINLCALSPGNMLKLSTLVASRQTLSLHLIVGNEGCSIAGCLERQYIQNYTSRFPSLTNLYHINNEERGASPGLIESNVILKNKANILPVAVLENSEYDISQIISIQNSIYERDIDDHSSLKRRKIRIKTNSKYKNKNKNKIEELQNNLQKSPISINPLDSNLYSTNNLHTSPLGKLNFHYSSNKVPSKRFPRLIENYLLPALTEITTVTSISTVPHEVHSFNEGLKAHHYKSNGSSINQQPKQIIKFHDPPSSPSSRSDSELKFYVDSNLAPRSRVDPQTKIFGPTLPFVGINHLHWKWVQKERPPPYVVK